jgi:hypothetical protein
MMFCYSFYGGRPLKPFFEPMCAVDPLPKFLHPKALSHIHYTHAIYKEFSSLYLQP